MGIDVHQRSASGAFVLSRIALSIVLAGCGALSTLDPAEKDQGDGTYVPPAGAGLQRVARLVVENSFNGTPHLTEMMQLANGTVVVANTSDLVAFRRDEAKGLVEHFRVVPDPAFLVCNAIAMHEPTHTIYCTSLDAQEVLPFDLPTQKFRRAPAQPSFQKIEYRDIFVQGSYLYAAAVKKGLVRHAIDATGELGPAESVWPGEIIGVKGDASRLLLFDRDSGLVILNTQETPFQSQTVALDGPMLDLKLHGNIATIALGSQGIAMVDIDRGAVVRHIEVPCVVFSADSKADQLAAGCSTGLLLYDLRAETPRVAGFELATYGLLDVAFFGDEIYAADWREMKVYRTNPAGAALQLDVLNGMPLKPGVGAKLKLRNYGDMGLSMGAVSVPAGTAALWDVPFASGDIQHVQVSTTAAPQDVREVAIVRRPNELSVGDAFRLPLKSAYVTFIQVDCTLQWPVLEDLGWLAKHNQMPDDLQPIVKTIAYDDGSPWTRTRFAELWPVPMTSLQSNYPTMASMAAFEQNFSKVHTIGGADITADYSVDSNGRIYAFDRVYRGRHPLR